MALILACGTRVASLQYCTGSIGLNGRQRQRDMHGPADGKGANNS